jgi:hypothetical protein
MRYNNIETNLTNRAFAVDAIELVNLNVRKIAPILNFTARSRRHQLASVTEDHHKRFAKLLVVLLITQASILLYQEAKARYTNRGDSIPRQFFTVPRMLLYVAFDLVTSNRVQTYVRVRFS